MCVCVMEVREGMLRAKVVVRKVGVDVEQDANRGQAAAGCGRSDSAAAWWERRAASAIRLR